MRLRSLTAAILGLLALACGAPPAPAQAPEDKALGRPATASSTEPARRLGPCTVVRCAAGKATDGRSDTRWASEFVGTAWWQVDLGRPRQVDAVALEWHRARASRYRIETSLDGREFTVAAEVALDLPASAVDALIRTRHHTETTAFAARTARYVRVTSLGRAPMVIDGETVRYGVSLWTASVFGPPDAPLPSATEAPEATVDEVMRPFPVVRIKGRLSGRGARIQLLSVRAPRAATISVQCRGASCPRRVADRPGGHRRIRELHRSLAAGTVVTVRVAQPGTFGTHTRFVIRRGRPPSRRDRCLRGAARRPAPCPAAAVAADQPNAATTRLRAR